LHGGHDFEKTNGPIASQILICYSTHVWLSYESLLGHTNNNFFVINKLPTKQMPFFEKIVPFY